ncbi:MAG: tetratricopeptide repeat protein [Planctomycetaceae bacterium]|jgi:tetratricopeptide (TPR) repeat protein|nr:tetratricopeptide repeat protein [Planctomycetaceae bacterium]
MQALSKVISIIFVALYLQFVCGTVCSQSSVLSGNSNLLNTVRESGEVVTNKQLQYYQNQAVKSSTSGQNTKPLQPMGGYPNNVTNINNNGKLNNNGVYVAASSSSLNLLPTNPVFGAVSSASNSLDVGAKSNGVTDSLATASPATSPSVSPAVSNVSSSFSNVPKSDAVFGASSSVVGARAVSLGGRENVPETGVVVGSVGGKVEGNSVGANLSGKGGLLPYSWGGESGGVEVGLGDKSDMRLKPTESMQSLLLNPQRLKSLLPSFLFRRKVDDVYLEDDGLEAVDKIRQGNVMTEQIYEESVTGAKSVVSREIFIKARREESAGNLEAALDLYKEFIKLNSRRTREGVLAAPYHRLALIVWRRSRELNEADVYFRYALKYAKRGIIQVVVNDYNKFLTECGKLDQAEAILRNTISLFPHESQLKVELGRCLARQDRPVEALRHIRPVLGEVQAYVELAMIYRGSGDIAMSDVFLQKRDEFIANSNLRDRVIAGGTDVKGDSKNIRNNNTVARRNNNNIESVSGVFLAADLGRGVGVGVQRGNSFPVVGREVVGRGNFEFPVDPFSVAAADGGGNNDVGFEGGDSTVLLSGGHVEDNLQEINVNYDNLSNNTIQVSENQLQLQPDSSNLPTYKIRGYHYSVENTAPVFLQY